jgi:hypothetical protein
MPSNAVDTSDSPDENLVKEVYAHFGLCVFFSQVIETNLINFLTALETAASKVPTRRTFDDLYAKHESFTFGNLMKALSAHGFLPNDVMQDVQRLKAERDHLAHRYFRDHDLDFMTVGGCNQMIDDLQARRDRFIEVDRRMSGFHTTALAKIGVAPEQIDTTMERTMVEMLGEARARWASKISKD